MMEQTGAGSSSSIEEYTFTNTRDLRCGEIFLLTDDGIDMYNTTGLNDCPADLWESLDPEKLKEQFQARAVIKNGPHRGVMDTLSVLLGKSLVFGALEARWIGRLPAAMARAHEIEPYSVFQPKKTGSFVYFRGSIVYELVSPEGDSYIMQAYGGAVDDSLTLEALSTLGDRLKLAPRWEYRARTIDEELTFALGHSTVYAVSDDLRNIYNRIAPSD
jgi:hypothetical protein